MSDLNIYFSCNVTTALMIITRRVFRLSAYTIMANISLADAVMALVAGIFCGGLILSGVPPEMNALVQMKHDDQLFLASNQTLILGVLNPTDIDDTLNNTMKR